MSFDGETSTPRGVQLAALGQRFGAVTALANLNLTIAPAACVGLIGSSGSGKTTLLRILAGLDGPTSGTVRFTDPDGRVDVSRPAIGMVFQNLALWPHLTARQHLACVQSATAGRSRLESLLAEVQLPSTAWDRRPDQLSGGEGQRLALARALACNPRLLLLDEPLAHLDAVLREDLLQQIAQVVRDRRITAVYVTHAWSEAAALCDRIGVLDQGQLQQHGTPQELFWRPVNPIVAKLTGPLVILPRAWLTAGQIEAGDASLSAEGIISADSGKLWLRPQQIHVIAPQGQNDWKVVDCRPREIAWQLELVNASHKLTLPATAAQTQGAHVGLRIACAPRE